LHPEPDQFAELLARYEETEFGDRDIAAGRGLSGWQCINPFAADLLEDLASTASRIDRVPYAYLEDDPNLSQQIISLHAELDGVLPQEVYSGAGANSLLFAYAAMLRQANIPEVYYLPPLYFVLQYALRLFRIRARPVAALHAFESGFSMNLPAKRSHLLLTDPVWYAGISVPEAIIESIRVWQRATGSTVFVDGSFQYMPWDHHIGESTANLDSNLTFRVVSPTKSLAIHGYRFAYVLLPQAEARSFANAHSTIYGSTNADTLSFARHAIDAVRARTMTDKLTALAQARHQKLRELRFTESSLQPDRGYFIFERVLDHTLQKDLMDGSFFDQTRFPQYARLNLLSPALNAFV